MHKYDHIIHRQTLEVGMLPGKSPYALQERVRSIYYDRVIPQLDKLFSGLAGDDVIIRIDKLDLDLGVVEAHQLEEQLTEKVLVAMKEHLEGKLRFDVADSGSVQVLSRKVSVADVLLYFLEEGRLPWWSNIERLALLEASLLEGGSLPEPFRVRLRELVGEVGRVLDRLVFQFSEAFLLWLMEECFPEGGPDHGTARTEWPEAANHRETKDIRDAFIAAARRHRRTADEKLNVTGGPAEMASKDDRDIYQQRAEAGEYKSRAGEREADVGQEATWPKRGSEEEDKVIGREKELSSAELTGPLDEGAGTVGRAAGSTSAEGQAAAKRADEKERADEKIRADARMRADAKKTAERRHGRRAPDDEGAVYPELAGLVLLHPFLSPFFDGLQLLEGKAFRDETARHKAVHLLGYLAMGLEEIEEPLLLFPKLLCGMESAEPVRRMGVLTADEREEAEKLLTTVAGYWKSLKSSSVAALREYFLQRRGKLSMKEEGWQLHMEKMTWDILLGSLPWGYSIVKLPWMKGMLFVSWG